jgi:hypothetical protein
MLERREAHIQMAIQEIAVPVTFKDIRLKLRLTAGVITALLVIGGFAGALAAFTDAPYALASHRYVDGKVDSALQVATARIGNLQRENGETRLQLNQVRRETLRSAKWTVAEQMKAAKDSTARRVFQERIEQIEDDLRDVDKERERLKSPVP